MISDAFVFCEEIELGLDSVVLFVQEVNLILQLCDSLLVDLLLILHTELLHILTSVVKATKPQDFIIFLAFNSADSDVV